MKRAARARSDGPLIEVDLSDEVVAELDNLGPEWDAFAERVDPDGVGDWPTPGAMAAELEGDDNPPHLELLDRKLVEFVAAVERHERPRLLITMPPRHGKTQRVVLRFVAWVLKKHPDWRFIIATYSADFSAEHGRGIRNFLREHEQEDTDRQVKGLGLRISPDSKAANRWNVDGHKGGVFAAGVDGGVTGRGANILIIDDPVKDWKEAQSATIREHAWTWFTGTAKTRLEPGGGVILIQTRWHEDDVAGRVLKREKAKWEHVDFPAVAEGDEATAPDALGRKPGEALWPDRYDRAELDSTKAGMPFLQWLALYQGRPVAEGGFLFKEVNDRWWRRIRRPDGTIAWQLGDGLAERVVDPGACWRWATADTATTKKAVSDWTVVSSWALTPDGDLLLLDVRRQRMEEGHLPGFITTAYRDNGCTYVGVESTFSTSTTAYELGRAGVRFRALDADVDKVQRSVPAQIIHENHRVFWPDGDGWDDGNERPVFMEEWLAEVHAFPNGTHDDQVDTWSYAALNIVVPGRRGERAPAGMREEGSVEARFDRWKKKRRARVGSHLRQVGT